MIISYLKENKMSIVEFIHNGFSTIIQCDQNVKMEEIVNKFINKTKLDKNSIFFLYNGDKIDINLSFNQLINEVDKKEKKLKILVSNLNESESNSLKFKSHEIICPKCGEIAMINIEDYRIKLSGVKMGIIQKIYYLMNMKQLNILTFQK